MEQPKAIEYVADMPIDSFEANPMNANTMGEKMATLLLENIKRNGFVDPILVWKAESKDRYQFIDGEHRWRAAKTLGYETIPTLINHNIHTQEEASLQLLMLNRIKGRFEQEKLSTLIGNLDKSFNNLSELTGYNRELIDALTRLANVPRVAGNEEEMRQILSEMSPNAAEVVDFEVLAKRGPEYESEIRSLFMVSLPIEDFMEINKTIDTIRSKENLQDLAQIVIKVFKTYAEDRLK